MKSKLQSLLLHRTGKKAIIKERIAVLPVLPGVRVPSLVLLVGHRPKAGSGRPLVLSAGKNGPGGLSNGLPPGARL